MLVFKNHSVIGVLGAVLLTVALTTGCEESVNPVLGTDRAFTLYGFFNPQADTQAVRIFAIEGRLELTRPEPPDAKVVSVMGDGSFAMAVGELETIKRLGLPVTLVVISNGSFGWIKAGQKYGYDAQYYSVDFSATDHAAVARAFGIKSYRVEAPGKLRSTLKKALAAGEPTLVDVVCQPLEEARAPVAEWVA